MHHETNVELLIQQVKRPLRLQLNFALVSKRRVIDWSICVNSIAVPFSLDSLRISLVHSLISPIILPPNGRGSRKCWSPLLWMGLTASRCLAMGRENFWSNMVLKCC